MARLPHKSISAPTFTACALSVPNALVRRLTCFSSIPDIGKIRTTRFRSAAFRAHESRPGLALRVSQWMPQRPKSLIPRRPSSGCPDSSSAPEPLKSRRRTTKRTRLSATPPSPFPSREPHDGPRARLIAVPFPFPGLLQDHPWDSVKPRRPSGS